MVGPFLKNQEGTENVDVFPGFLFISFKYSFNLNSAISVHILMKYGYEGRKMFENNKSLRYL